MNQQDLKNLAAYIADYVNEEINKGTTYIDRFMIQDAIDAYLGGAYE
jgi:hypothetical protein